MPQDALRPLKKLVRRIARRMGYDIVSNRAIPFGHDVMLDIRKLCSAWGRKVDVFFDVGANVGQTVDKVVRAFPTARVFAFEPTPSTFAELKKSIEQLPNVEAFDVAFGVEPGKAELFVYDLPVLNSLVPNTPYSLRFNPPARKIEVDVTTLDNFCATHNIDYINVLKIDTEGFDLPILQGAETLFATGRIDFVYIEFNDILPGFDATGGALAPICELLRPHNMHFIASYTDYVVTEGDLFVVSNALLARK